MLIATTNKLVLQSKERHMLLHAQREQTNRMDKDVDARIATALHSGLHVKTDVKELGNARARALRQSAVFYYYSGVFSADILLLDCF
jgi:hypothetical protein